MDLTKVGLSSFLLHRYKLRLREVNGLAKGKRQKNWVRSHALSRLPGTENGRSKESLSDVKCWGVLEPQAVRPRVTPLTLPKDL